MSKLSNRHLPTYLFVIPSTCQMYSGTGTAIFDWVSFAQQHFNFIVMMDVSDSVNYAITKQFCNRNGIRLIASAPRPLAGCCDSGIESIGFTLESEKFDFIECVSWANAATNLSVKASRKQNSKLVFTPHSQPIWTLPDCRRYFMTESAFEKMLCHADIVFADSSAELMLPAFQSARPSAVEILPLGVSDEFSFRPDIAIDANRILCICDCRESRKRLDLLFEVFRLVLKRMPTVQLLVGGKGSDQLEIPSDIRSSVTTLGYVQKSQLLDLYQTSALLTLFSDYEAFGLPIAEALTSGCPVVLNDLDVLHAIFDGLKGVHFVRNTDFQRAAGTIVDLLNSEIDRASISNAARVRFSFEATYGRKLQILKTLRALS